MWRRNMKGKKKKMFFVLLITWMVTLVLFSVTLNGFVVGSIENMDKIMDAGKTENYDANKNTESYSKGSASVDQHVYDKIYDKTGFDNRIYIEEMYQDECSLLNSLSANRYKLYKVKVYDALPPHSSIFAVTSPGKTYDLSKEFNQFLNENDISLVYEDLLDITKLYVISAYSDKFDDIKIINSFQDIPGSKANPKNIDNYENIISTPNVAEYNGEYRIVLHTWSKINGVLVRWDVTVLNNQITDTVWRVIDIGVGDFELQTEGFLPVPGLTNEHVDMWSQKKNIQPKDETTPFVTMSDYFLDIVTNTTGTFAESGTIYITNFDPNTDVDLSVVLYNYTDGSVAQILAFSTVQTDSSGAVSVVFTPDADSHTGIGDVIVQQVNNPSKIAYLPYYLVIESILERKTYDNAYTYKTYYFTANFDWDKEKAYQFGLDVLSAGTYAYKLQVGDWCFPVSEQRGSVGYFYISNGVHNISSMFETLEGGGESSGHLGTHCHYGYDVSVCVQANFFESLSGMGLKYRTQPEGLKLIVAHEHFHNIQYGIYQWAPSGTEYPSTWDWLTEGSARFQETIVDPDANFIPTNLLYMAGGGGGGDYLANPNTPLEYVRYNYCLWWGYIYQHDGGIDTIKQIMQAIPGVDPSASVGGPAAIDAVLSQAGGEHTSYVSSLEGFMESLYTKEFSWGEYDGTNVKNWGLYLDDVATITPPCNEWLYSWGLEYVALPISGSSYTVTFDGDDSSEFTVKTFYTTDAGVSVSALSLNATNGGTFTVSTPSSYSEIVVSILRKGTLGTGFYSISAPAIPGTYEELITFTRTLPDTSTVIDVMYPDGSAQWTLFSYGYCSGYYSNFYCSPWDATWSNDGRELTFGALISNDYFYVHEIFVSKADGGEAYQLSIPRSFLEGPVYDRYHPSFSYDDTKVLYADAYEAEGTYYSLFYGDLNTFENYFITDQFIVDLYPDLSPVDDYVLCDMPPDLYEFDMAVAQFPLEYTEHADFTWITAPDEDYWVTDKHTCPEWSPDGTAMLFVRHYDDTWNNFYGDCVYMLSDDFYTITAAYEHDWGAYRINHAAWSPDGTQAVFDLDGDLWKININGTGLTQLTNTGNCSGATWSNAVVGGSISGKVMDYSGNPIQGATVTLLDTSTTSDSNGDYSIQFSTVSGMAPLFVEATGYDTAAKYASLRIGAITGPNIFLEPTATTGAISGRVVKSDGVTPIEGANIDAKLSGIVQGNATSDENGDFLIQNLPAGTYDVTATATIYETTTITGVEVSAGNTTSVVIAMNISIGKVGNITGHVYKSGTSDPIAGATVSTDTGGYSATTDANGAYTIFYVAPGTYNLTASASGYYSSSETVSVTAGDTTVQDFYLIKIPTGSIAGTVKDDSDAPIAGATVRVNGTSYSAVTNSAGEYTIQDVPIGTYNVTATKSGYQSSTVFDILVYESQITYANFTLSPIPLAKWTYICYLDGDNNLWEAGDSDFTEISGVGSTSEVNIVVLKDNEGTSNTNLYYINIGGGSYTTIQLNNVNSSWSNEVDMGSLHTLIDFAKWVIDNYPAEHYALDLWDHGGGYDGVCWDDTSSTHITMPDLRYAMSSITDHLGRPIDLIIHNSCLMAELESNYDVKAYAEIIVHSEEIVPGDGIPYASSYGGNILGNLINNSAWTSEEFAIDIVNQYGTRYTLGNPGADGNQTYSAVNLTKLDDSLILAVNNFAQKLKHITGTYSSQIEDAWYDVEYYEANELVDLYHFASLVKTNVPDTEAQEAAQYVMDNVTSCVISEWHGTGHPNSYGLTICFPYYNQLVDIYAKYESLHMTVETKWIDFLFAFFEQKDYSNTEPICTITSPSDDEDTQQGDVVTISGTASDTDGINKTQIKIDRGDWLDATGTTSWSYELNTSDLSLGKHKVYARALDNKGSYDIDRDYSWYQCITVNIVVPTEAPQLSYNPASLDFGTVAPSYTGNKTFEIWNSGTGTLTYTLSETADWLSVTPTSGSSTGEHDPLTVSIDTTGLADNTYTATITISSNGGTGNVTVNATVQTSEVPQLAYYPSTLAFGTVAPGYTGNDTFEVWNSGTGTLSYTISESAAWLTVTPASGDSTGEHDAITVSIDTTGLADNTYTSTISISSNGGTGSVTVNVTVQTSEVPQLYYYPASLDFGTVAPSYTGSKTFEIWNSGTGTLSYTLTESADWLSITPSSGSSAGEHDTITVSIDTAGLADDTYAATISISSNGDSGTVTVNVTVETAVVPELAYYPSTLDFGTVEPEYTGSKTFEVWNSGTGTLSYTITESVEWLSVAPGSGDSAGEHDTIAVSINTTGLADTYTATVSISSNGGTGNVTINMTVQTAANTLPTASANADKTTITEGDIVSFVGTASDSDGTISSWYWNFGDGITSTAQNPTHQYTAASTYTVTLTVTDDDGASGTATVIITVNKKHQQSEGGSTPGFEAALTAITILGVCMLLLKKRRKK